MVLLAVPGAAVGLAQPMHEPGQAEGIEAGLDCGSSAGNRCGPAASASAVTSPTVVWPCAARTACAGGYRRCSSETGSGPCPWRPGRVAYGVPRVGLSADRRQHHQRHAGVEGPGHEAVEGDELQALGRVDRGALEQRGEGGVGQQGTWSGGA